MYHTYNYEIFHLKLGFIGRLSPDKFEEMSAEIRKVYSTSEPLGEYNSWVDRFEPLPSLGRRDFQAAAEAK
jgi:hypothetical protein